MVKLNIEMAMANLIKRIAVTNSRLPGMAAAANEYKDESGLSTSDHRPAVRNSKHDPVELNGLSYHPEVKSGNDHDRIASLPPGPNQIRSTTKYTVTSEPNPFAEQKSRGPKGEDANEQIGRYGIKPNSSGLIEVETRSLDSSAERAESLQDSEIKRAEDSDDEVVLVGKKGRW